MNVRTKGFCWALLRCGEIKLIAEKRVYAIKARERSGAEQSYGTQFSLTL